MESLTNRHQRLLNTCTNSLASCAELLERYSSETEKLHQLNLIRKLAREYSETDIKFKQSQSACNSCEEHFNSVDVDASENVVDAYNRFLNEDVCEVTLYTEHPVWKSVNEAILRTQQDVLEEETSNDNSMIISQQFQMPIDPLTKKNIENPCKSKVCGHIFEYNTIVPYIKLRQQSKSCRCPHVGCTNTKMQLSDLVVDENLRDILQSQTMTEDIE